MARRRTRRTTSRWTPVKSPAPRLPTRTVTTPGSPGVRTPTVQPFSTAQDLFSRAEFESRRDTDLADLDYQLAERQAQATYDLRENERSAKIGRSTANDVNAARGLFQSSLRDAALIDVDTNELIQRETIQRGLDLMRQRVERQRGIWRGQEESYNTAEGQRQIENAQSAMEGVPEYVPGREPTPAVTRKVPVIVPTQRAPRVVRRTRQPTTRTRRRVGPSQVVNSGSVI